MNRKKHLTLFSSLLLAFSLTACSNTDNDTSNEEVVDTTATDAKVETEVVASNKDKSVAKNGFSASTINMADYKVIDLSSMENLDWLTPFLLANTSQEITDEDKVRLFSDEYNSETDGFKKKDMFNELLPKVKQEIKRYENANIIVKAPIIESVFDDQYMYKYMDEQTEKGLLTILSTVGLLGAYDFDVEGFSYFCDMSLSTLDPHGGMVLVNKNGIDIKNLYELNKSYNKIHCETDGLKQRTRDSDEVATAEDFLEVNDEALARKIEETTAGSGLSKLSARGDAYYVLKIMRNNIYAIPLKANVEYFNTETKESLLRKQLKFTWDGDV